MEIRSISEKIFRTAPNKAESNSNHTNPFGVNFKGNIISADVFESANKEKVSFGSKVAGASNKSKLAISAFVGSINKSISTRLDSIVSFGKRIGERAAKTWEFLNTTNLSLNLELVERKSKELFRLDLGNNYKTRSIEDLKSCFKEEVLAMEAV